MGTKNYTEVTCDGCGHREKAPRTDGGLPARWVYLTPPGIDLGRSLTFCCLACVPHWTGSNVASRYDTPRGGLAYGLDERHTE